MRLGIVISALVVFLSIAARAEESAPDADFSWSVGAGLGGTGILRGKTTQGPQPGPDNVAIEAEITTSPTVSIERRVGRRSWLIGRASFDFALDSVGPWTNTAASTNAGTKSTTLDGSLGVGLRVVAANIKRVQISAFGMAGFGVTNVESKHVRWHSDEGIPKAETTVYRAGASFGVMCDAFLSQNVAVRLSTPLVGMTYTNGMITTFGSETGEMPSSSVKGGVVVSPSLEFRIVF